MKKILFAAFAAATIGLAGYNVIESIQTAELSDLTLKNIEALAEDEATSKNYNCYSILIGEGKSISCATCQMEEGTPPWYHFGDSCTRE